MVRVILFFLFASQCYAHSGGLDANGGHHDRKNGGYHFHGGGGGSRGSTRTSSSVPRSSLVTASPASSSRTRREQAPRPTALKPERPLPYWKKHGLKLHTFHANDGRSLVRGQAESISAGRVLIIRSNGEHFTTPLRELAVVDRAMVSSIEEVPQDDPFAPVSRSFLKEWRRGFRTWKSSNGKFSVVAKAAELSDEAVLLRMHDSIRTKEVPLARLSAADREYLERLREAAGDAEEI